MHLWGAVQWGVSTLPLLCFQSTVWLLNHLSVSIIALTLMKYTPQLYYKIIDMFRIKSLSHLLLYTCQKRGCLPHSKCSTNIYWINLVETTRAIKTSFLPNSEIPSIHSPQTSLWQNLWNLITSWHTTFSCWKIKIIKFFLVLIWNVFLFFLPCSQLFSRNLNITNFTLPHGNLLNFNIVLTLVILFSCSVSSIPRSPTLCLPKWHHSGHPLFKCYLFYQFTSFSEESRTGQNALWMTWPVQDAMEISPTVWTLHSCNTVYISSQIVCWFATRKP